jgi:hypothetical protein
MAAALRDFVAKPSRGRAERLMVVDIIDIIIVLSVMVNVYSVCVRCQEGIQIYTFSPAKTPADMLFVWCIFEFRCSKFKLRTYLFEHTSALGLLPNELEVARLFRHILKVTVTRFFNRQIRKKRPT